MSELSFRPLILPALVVGQIAVPFSLLIAPGLYWHNLNLVAMQTLAFALGGILVVYVLIESLRHYSLLAGMLVGLWASLVGAYPALIRYHVTRSATGMLFDTGASWTNLLTMVVPLIKASLVGIGLGAVFSLIPWMLHRRRASVPAAASARTSSAPRRIATVVLAVMPLLTALCLSRRVDWVLQSYAAGVSWTQAVRSIVGLEIALRIVVLCLTVLATFLFFVRLPAARPVATALLAIVLAATVHHLFAAALIALPESTRTLQTGINLIEPLLLLLTAGLLLPWLVEKPPIRKGRAETTLSEVP